MPRSHVRLPPVELAVILGHRYSTCGLTKPSLAREHSAIHCITSRRSQKLEGLTSHEGLRVARTRFFSGLEAKHVIFSTEFPFYSALWSCDLPEEPSATARESHATSDHLELRSKKYGCVALPSSLRPSPESTLLRR